MTTLENLTPQQRLANSRQAIVGYMARGQDEAAGVGRPDPTPDNTPPGPPGSVWKILKRTALTWWQHHPAHMAIDVAAGVAKPVLSKYAEEKPIQLLGAAAALGAALVIMRPWRLMSLTGLLLATVKSSDLAPALLSLITTQHELTRRSEDISKTG
jgi:hypothetical protein